MISSELLTDLLYPEGDTLMGPLAHGRMQALLDAVPVGLLEFRLEEDGLYLWASNAAARRMPGLGLVREEGVLAQVVFDQLAHTTLVEQLCAVARLGVPLDCRQVVREGTRLLLAWDLSARRVADNCIVVSVRDVSEAENLRMALAQAESALADARRDLQEQTEVFNTMESLAQAGHWRRIEGPGETVLLWSPGLCDIAGFERQEWLGNERAVSGIPAEDRPVFDQACRLGDGSGVEYRWRRPDGEVRWMRSRVRHGGVHGRGAGCDRGAPRGRAVA